MPNSSPLTNTTALGRYSHLLSTTVNSLTASQLFSLDSQIDKRCRRAADCTLIDPIFHRHAFHNHAVEGAVAGLQCLTLLVDQPAEAVSVRHGGKIKAKQGKLHFAGGSPIQLRRNRRIAPSVLRALSGPQQMLRFRSSSHARAATSTSDSVKRVMAIRLQYICKQ